MNPPTLLSLVPLGLLLAPFVHAQQSSVVPFALTAPTAMAAHIDEPFADGVFWVRGDTYKARLDTAGVTFAPLFAGAAQHTPMRLHYRDAAASVIERDGQTLVLRHSPTLVERWEARPLGMEQSFVLASRPATADLTLHIDVETNLRYRGYDRGLVFAADGLGTITYGEGVVFDRVGHRAPIVPTFTGNSITLHVPESFLAGATYPVTIDPLLANFVVSQSGSNDFHPDVVREPTTGDFMVIFEEALNGTDHDIVAHRYRADGSFVSRVFFDVTTDLCVDPKICATLGATGVLAVWDDNGNAKGIQAREYRLTAATFGTTAQVTSDGFGVDSRHPDVGGGTNFGVNNHGQMAVYVRVAAAVNFSLRGVPLLSTGIPSGAEYVIDGTPGCDPRPDIAPSGGNPLHWGVAWQEKNVACGGGDVWAAVVNLGGVILAPRSIDDTPGEDELLPRVFTDDKDTMIVWQANTSAFAEDVDGVLLRRSSTSNTFSVVGPFVSLSAFEPNCNRSLVQNQPALGFDGTRYSYVYMEGQRPKGACMFAGSYTFSEGHASLSATTNACGAPAIAYVPTNASPVRYAVVWQEDVGPRFEVRGAFYEGREPGSTVTTGNTGCGVHGLETQIGIDQVPAVGHDFTVSLTNVVGVPLLIVGPPAATPVTLCGGLNPCRQGITNILTSLFVPSLHIVLPGDPSFVGLALAFQGADLGAGGGCNAGVFGVPFRTTDTLTVTFR